MKKTIISTMTIAALLFSQSLQAESGQTIITEEMHIDSLTVETTVTAEESIAESNETAVQAEATLVTDDALSQAETEGVTETSKTVHEASRKSKRKNWSHVLLAAGAIAIAVVVLILVSNHSGQKSHG